MSAKRRKNKSSVDPVEAAGNAERDESSAESLKLQPQTGDNSGKLSRNAQSPRNLQSYQEEEKPQIMIRVGSHPRIKSAARKSPVNAEPQLLVKKKTRYKKRHKTTKRESIQDQLLNESSRVNSVQHMREDNSPIYIQ